MGDQFRQQFLGLQTLGVQGILGIVQFTLGDLQFCLLRFQFILGDGDLLRCGTHLCQTALVSGGDLLDHVQPVHQVGKAAGLEEHGPVGNGTVFFHGADALLVLLSQVGHLLAGIVQFILLVCNQQRIGGQLLVDVIDLLMEQENLLIQLSLFVENIGDFILVLIELVLDILHLGLQILLLLFQSVDLLLDLAGRRSADTGGNDAENDTQDHHHSQETRHDGSPQFTFLHSLLLWGWDQT